MKELKNRKLNAVVLRNILTGLLFLTLALCGASFYFGQSMLHSYALEVSEATAKATASEDNVQTLQRLKQELEKQSVAKQRAEQVVAESQSYQYQDQIITDLTRYAKDAGVNIKEFNFNASALPGAAPASPSGVAATPPATTTGGLKSTTVSVLLQTPVNYPNLLTFINSVEQNLTKMQISKISLTKDDAGGNDAVTSDAFLIEVYIR